VKETDAIDLFYGPGLDNLVLVLFGLRRKRRRWWFDESDQEFRVRARRADSLGRQVIFMVVTHRLFGGTEYQVVRLNEYGISIGRLEIFLSREEAESKINELIFEGKHQ